MNNVASSLHSSVKTAAKATSAAATTTVKTAAKVITNNYHEYTWEELEVIEQRRRAILKRGEDPFWSILAHWDGTVLNQLFHETLFWITIIIYAIIRVWARIGIPDYVADLGSGDIGVIGGFTSLLLVFYVNQSNSRYFSLYGASCVCNTVSFFLVSKLPNSIIPRQEHGLQGTNL